MTGHSRRKQEIAVREAECWRRRIEGDTQEVIAAALGISQPAVSQILRRLGERFAVEFTEEVRAQKSVQTARLEALYVETVRQWRHSCQDAERTTVVSGRVKATDSGMLMELPDQTTHVIEGQSGNPALLAQARGFLADIRSIWGLDIVGRLDELEALIAEQTTGGKE